jgi:uncharacterized protein YlaN (UPF0358 family)
MSQVSKINLCPCQDDNIIIAEDCPLYVESLDSVSKTIYELKKELEIKDKYIKHIIGFIKDKNKLRIIT